MANIKLEVNDAETLKLLHGLTPEQFIRAGAKAAWDLARKHVEEKIGGDFGRRIADSIEQRVDGITAEIWAGKEDGYIGEHVHAGGVIQSRNGKKLAIPLRNITSRQYNPRRLFARELTIPLFAVKFEAQIIPDNSIPEAIIFLLSRHL